MFKYQTGRLALAGLLAALLLADNGQGFQASGEISVGQAASDSADNILIVLDASGSMKDRMRSSRMTRMEAAKKAMLAVLENPPAGANVGLLVFSGANLETDWLYPLGPVDKERLRAAIMRPQPDGGTPLGAYLKKGADALLQQRQKQHGYGSYRLLLVTDGEANDPDLLNQYLPDVLSRGITLDVIGVDMTSDHALATRVHSYRRADNPEDFVKVIQQVFAEVGGGQTNDAASAEQFAAIEPLPEELASAALTAFATPSNHPIGESAGETNDANSPSHPAPDFLPTPVADSPSWAGAICSVVGFACVGGILVLIVLGFVVKGMAGPNRGGRR